MNQNQKKILTTVLVMGTSHLIKQVIDRIYEKARDEEAPKNPAKPDQPWGKALLYTAGVGLVAAFIKVAVREKVTKMLET